MAMVSSRCLSGKAPWILVAISLSWSDGYAQTFTVRGKVASLAGPVKYASVTFVDESDVGKEFSTLTDSSGDYLVDIITPVRPPVGVPERFHLQQNYPNPFSSTTTIVYTLEERTEVAVGVYDILGREVKRLAVGMRGAGGHSIIWDGTNNYGGRVSPGVYFYRLTGEGKTSTKKMVLMTGDARMGIDVMARRSYQMLKQQNKGLCATERKTYSIRISNVDSTEPKIAALEVGGVGVWTDTLIDFKVKRMPVARTGGDLLVREGQYVVLDGSASNRGDGDTLIYEWSADSSNPAQLLYLSFDPEITLGFVKKGVYRFFLRVNDGILDSEPVEVTISVAARGESVFTDPVMELQVRYAAKNPTGILTEEELAKIDTLVSDRGMGQVTLLNGVELCSSLICLAFGINKITDLSPLSSLTKLQSLSLDQNYGIADVSPLANLTELRKLNLQDNNIKDVSPLRSLTKLRTLVLLNNPIRDISSLADLQDLTDFWIEYPERKGLRLEGVSVISKFKNLYLLWISSYDLRDISFVSPLIGLQYLRASFCNVGDISPLANCTGLLRLYLDSNNITDVTALEGLKELNVLDLRYNKITNIEPLVKNDGLGLGDAIGLAGNPLDSVSVNTYIAVLRNRGATIYY